MNNRTVRRKRLGAMALCLLLSLLLHLILLSLLTFGGGQRGSRPATAAAQPQRQRLVRVQRSAPDAPTTEQDKPQAFAKISADALQALPEQADYQGSRNTRAASDPAPEHLRAAQNAPAQQGEDKDELVTFDQERREGDPEHETPTPPPTPPQLTAEDTDRSTEQPTPPPAPGTEIGTSPTPRPEATDSTDQTPPAVLTTAEHPPAPNGELLLRTDEQPEMPDETERPTEAASLGTASGTGEQPAPPRPRSKRRPVFYDPSLAAPQPGTVGFRTQERKTRSRGRFIMGSGAALNVSATPLGRYESEIYRRIAYHWYRACDEHRGDIIPGSITISLRINKSGYLENMDLVRRSGAGIIQQSFTFRAIRQASLPPMPQTVRREIVGELLELIFTFNFD